MITKQELIEQIEKQQKEIEALKKQILEQGDIKATVDLKDKAIASEFEARKEIQKFKEEIKNKDVQIKNLGESINRLSALFEEYVVAYEEQVTLNQITIKNSVMLKDTLRNKIENYNKGVE